MAAMFTNGGSTIGVCDTVALQNIAWAGICVPPADGLCPCQQCTEGLLLTLL